MDGMILSGKRRLGQEALLDRAARAAFGFVIHSDCAVFGIADGEYSESACVPVELQGGDLSRGLGEHRQAQAARASSGAGRPPDLTRI
jgi:hypothetical protein